MIVTYQFIHQGASDSGYWNKKQLAILGEQWPPIKGWPKRVIGKEISDTEAKKFIELRKPSKPQPQHEFTSLYLLSYYEAGKGLLPIAVYDSFESACDSIPDSCTTEDSKGNRHWFIGPTQKYAIELVDYFTDKC